MHHLLAGRAAADQYVEASRPRGQPAGDGEEEPRRPASCPPASEFQFREKGGNNRARRRHGRRRPPGPCPPTERAASRRRRSTRAPCFSSGAHHEPRAHGDRASAFFVRSNPAARGPSDGSRNPQGWTVNEIPSAPCGRGTSQPPLRRRGHRRWPLPPPIAGHWIAPRV